MNVNIVLIFSFLLLIALLIFCIKIAVPSSENIYYWGNFRPIAAVNHLRLNKIFQTSSLNCVFNQLCFQ
jgi:hypothetical protein